ncbi:MAG: hypothetical protein WC455_12355 [Dehalococcoidia bacterium]|jgi:hypothetical protein
MNSKVESHKCPHCHKDWEVTLEYNSQGVIKPQLVCCGYPDDNEAVNQGCLEYFVVQGMVETLLYTSITPIPKLSDALKRNGNSTPVAVEGGK